jgi:hypothetical protein
MLNLLTRLGHPRQITWNVPIRERYGHGAGVVTSLARYLRGGPSKNARLVACDGARVTFTCRARPEEAEGGQASAQRITLAVTALLQRWLLHVPVPQTGGGALVRPVSRHAGGGAGRLPCPSGPAAGRGAPAAGVADGVCAARGPAPGARSGVWPVARVHRGDPAWRCAAVGAVEGACRMHVGLQGRACPGCGVPAHGPGTVAAGRLWHSELPRRPTVPVVPRGTGPIVAVPGRLAEGERHGNSIASGWQDLVRPHRYAVRPTRS